MGYTMLRISSGDRELVRPLVKEGPELLAYATGVRRFPTESSTQSPEGTEESMKKEHTIEPV